MKEQLIRELVKNDRESRQLNEQYQSKIYTLQQEKENAYTELNNLQMALKENEMKEKNDKVRKDNLHVLVYAHVHLHTILPCIISLCSPCPTFSYLPLLPKFALSHFFLASLICLFLFCLTLSCLHVFPTLI